MTLRFRSALFLNSLKRRHRAKTVGLIVGVCGEWFGAIVGLGIGWMIDAILSQNRTDRAILSYLENPGPSSFTEAIPGSAAFCALSALVAENPDGPLTAASVARTAAAVFGVAESEHAEFETFARIAAARTDSLNPDLLAESLIARRNSIAHDEPIREAMRGALESLAASPSAKETVERVSRLLTPSRPRKGNKKESDPYRILGIGRDSTVEEAKAVYRRLAAQFHPDATAGLDETQRQSAAEAFIRIDSAYKTILEDRNGKI